MKKYLYHLKGLIFSLTLVTILSSISLSLSPIIIGDFIENIETMTSTKILYYALAFVLNVILILVFEFINKINYSRFYRKLMIQIKNDMFISIFKKNYTDFYSKNTEDYINLFIEDMQILYEDYYDTIVSMITTIISFVVYTSIVFVLNWIMALAILATAAISLVIPKLTGRKLTMKRKQQSEANSQYLGKLKDLLAGYTANNSLTFEKFIEEHQKVNAAKENKTYAYNKYNSFIEIFGGFSLYIMNIVVFVVGMVLIHYQYLKVSELVVLISFTDLMVFPIRDFIYQVINIKSSKAITSKMEEVLISSDHPSKKAVSFNSSIELKNIQLTRDEFELNIPYLCIEKGKKYAIVGPTGSGKSTLLKIIMNHYTDYEGKIMIDGEEVKEYDLSNVVSEINQNAFIFNGTAIDNITLFGSYSKEHLDMYMEKLNASYLKEKDLGEFGSRISGGERNKICILRALCKGCKILACDEMLANLDVESKKDINRYLLNDRDLTVLSITHDLNPEHLRMYDRIIVLKNGQFFKEIDTNNLANEDMQAFLWD